MQTQCCLFCSITVEIQQLLPAFQNRLLYIIPGKPKEADAENGNRGGEQFSWDDFEGDVDRPIVPEFRKKRHSELRSMALVRQNWHPLFVSVDAVATNLSASSVSRRWVVLN